MAPSEPVSMTEKTGSGHPPSPGDNKEVGEGVVIRSTGSWYEVKTDEGIVPSKVRGRFRLMEEDVTNPIAVGDRVTLRLNPDGTGLITDIHERRNRLSRRAAGRRVGHEQVLVANVDRVWIMQSVRMPKPNPGFVDRVLTMTEAHEIDAGLVINKIDLMEESDGDEIDEIQELYAGLGYPVILTSARTGAGIDDLREQLLGQTNVITGPSGVGKSSVLNAVEPDLGLRTSGVSERTQKGKHVTTNATLFPLSAGGYVVDTPGLREFGVLDIEPWELSHFFVEFKPYVNECRFPTCTHDHEPGCAVKQAVEDGYISEERYRSYLNILDSINLGEKDVGR